MISQINLIITLLKQRDKKQYLQNQNNRSSYQEIHQFNRSNNYFTAQKMTEKEESPAIQQTPQLALMRAKFPRLKQKLSQPFPYFYQLVPKDQVQYNQKIVELTNKLKDNPELASLNQYLPLIFGKSQGMPAEVNYKNQLMKTFNYENKDFWEEITKQKVTSKNYGLPKQKSYSIWQVKDVQQLKDFFDVEQVKKQRKIMKQFSTFYKSIHKFSEKFEKLKQQNQISDLYQQYKKVEQEESKFNKLVTGDKNKLAKVSKIDAPLPEIKPQIYKQQAKIENVQKQSNKMVQNSPMIPQEGQNKEKQPVEKVKEQKQSKKKSQAKQQSSNKKQAKVTIDKQQQMMSQYKSLDLFFKKKKPEIEVTEKLEPLMQMEPEQVQIVNKTDELLSFLNNAVKMVEINDLQSQFRAQKKIKNVEIKTTYVNIVMKRSRLQYYDFPVAQAMVSFIDPFSQTDNVRYDDSSDEYSQLIADSINEEMIQQEQEEEQQSESNSAIVSDDFCEYKSSHVFSSQDSSDQQQVKLKPQSNKSVGKWFFSFKSTIQKNQKYLKYQMVCLIQEPFPLITKEQAQENSNQITAVQKIEMYKQIHGSYTAKEILIKKINTIVQNKISMNKLSTMIKDLCEKKGNQRVVKNQIIRQIAEEFSQLNPNLQAQFEQLRSERQTARNQQIEAKRQQKLNQRDNKLQRLILDYEGIMTTNAILQYLKNNQMKMIKQELNSIIKTKQGEFWQHIRNQIKKAKLIKCKSKKQKQPKPKKDENQELINSHRPIDQILKQNQIDMMNKPKKEKKVKPASQMVDEVQEQMQQQQHEPQDDESFQLDNKKPKKKNKRKGKKTIVKISPHLPPLRRNPKRNKKKSKYASEQKKQDMENEQQENEDCQKNEEQEQQKEIMQNEEREPHQNQGEMKQNMQCNGQNAEMIQENENKCNQEEKQEIHLQGQKTEQKINSCENQMMKLNNQQVKNSPTKNQQEIQQSEQKINQKTANKPAQGQQIQINV